jgi:O-antigen/teichoic acid export membrane protein
VLGLLEHNVIYVDHLLVVGLFGLEALGVYNIALVVSEVVRMLGFTLGIVLGPRLVQRLAAEGGTIETVREITLTPVHLLAVGLPFVVPVICFGAQAGLLQFYPRYAGAVPLLPVLLLAAQFLALNNGTSLFLFAVGKQGRAAVLTGATVVLDVVIACWLAQRGLGVSAIAWASLAAYLVFVLAYLTYVGTHFRSSLRARLAFLGGAFAPGLYLAFVLWLVGHLVANPSWPSGAIVSIIASWLLLSPLALRARRLLNRIDLFTPLPGPHP